MNKGVKNTIAIGVGYVIIKWTAILLIGGALYKSGYWSNWYLLAIPVIGIATFMIRQRIKSNKNKKSYVDD
jgi:hypothetical protein